MAAGSYTKGDVIQLGVIDGPAVVRSGRGAAILKRIMVGTLTSASGAAITLKVSIKNQN